MRSTIFYVASLLAVANALTITSPSDGQSLDPTQPITVSWTSTSSDPDTFDIILDNSESGGLTANVKLASNVPTSSGNYVLSASSAMAYGEGFVLKAESSSGEVLATSPSFTLSLGSATTIDGQISYVPTVTYTGTVSEGPATATDAANAATTTDAVTPTSNAQATLGEGSTSSTTGTNGFTTSTVSRSGSSTGTSSSSSASATTSQNAQPKLVDSSQIAFTVGGLIAGLAALMA